MALEIREDLKYYAKLMQGPIGLVAGQVEVTSRCYQRCKYCESWRPSQPQDEWTGLELLALLRGLSTLPTFEHLTLTGGDPQAWEPLTDVLRGWHGHGCFDLQVSTPLSRNLTAEEVSLWRAGLSDVRVSLDAVSPDIYAELRGVGVSDASLLSPEAVLCRMKNLAHPRMATLTTVYRENLLHVPQICERLAEARESGDIPLRKAMFLIGLGPRMGELDEGFVEEWRRVSKYMCRLYPWTSFAEDPLAVRHVLEKEEGEFGTLCRIGHIGFHLKSNRTYYPCCLQGGEAIPTNLDFRIGQHGGGFRGFIEAWRSYTPRYCYGPGGVCSRICQWKQFSLNRVAELASQRRLAIP